MVKYHILSNYGQYNRTRILIFTYMVNYISRNIVSNIWASTNVFTQDFFFINLLFPALSALSRISGNYGAVVTSQNGGDKAST